MTEYEYEYYLVFQKLPNTNTNTSIRPQLFEYYSNTQLFAHLCVSSILIEEGAKGWDVVEVSGGIMFAVC